MQLLYQGGVNTKILDIISYGDVVVQQKNSKILWILKYQNLTGKIKLRYCYTTKIILVKLVKRQKLNGVYAHLNVGGCMKNLF